MINQKQLKKAHKWINNKCRDNYLPVVDCRWGYAGFVAYLFRLRREEKPDIRYVINLNEDQSINSIKRICVNERKK